MYDVEVQEALMAEIQVGTVDLCEVFMKFPSSERESSKLDAILYITGRNLKSSTAEEAINVRQR
jgi:hypothetical protein